MHQQGFDNALSSPTIISHLLCVVLHGAPLKSRILAAELLAAVCMLSADEGHRSVLAAFSEYRTTHEERFRFQSLVAALEFPELSELMTEDAAALSEKKSVWEACVAFMELINSLTNGPNSVEERILLREEFSHRGLNEVLLVCLASFFRPSLSTDTAIQNLRHANPPDVLLTQLNLYVEEKFEDEEEFCERARRSVQASHGCSLDVTSLVSTLKSVPDVTEAQELAHTVEDILRKLNDLIQDSGDLSVAYRVQFL